MIDHIELRTRDLAASVRFYAAVLEPLGYRQSVDGAAKGFGDARGPDFFLIAGEPADCVDYAFRATSRAIVRAC
jgi:catechol 2,3-dioxygenase-like lactoylglutathione lyase family enzyme